MKDEDAVIGAKVILVKYTKNGWVADMGRYVGDTVEIIEVIRTESDGNVYCGVSNNDFLWCVKHLTLADCVSAYQNNPVCVECGIPNPYAQVKDNERYHCKACSLRQAYFG